MNFDKDMSFEEFMDRFADVAKKFHRVQNEAISDRISSTDRWYQIQTGPYILSENPDDYITVVVVETFDHKKHSEPCGVQLYESREDAIRGHDYWRRMLMDNPMKIFKDAVTSKIITVDF